MLVIVRKHARAAAEMLAYPLVVGHDGMVWGGHGGVGNLTASGNKPKTMAKGAPRPKQNEEPEGEPPDPFEGPGPYSVESDAPEEVGHDCLMVNGDFMREQREDPTLSCAWEQMTNTKEEGGNDQQIPQGPHFKVHNDRLYQMTKDLQTQEVLQQLLVSRKFQRDLMHLSHSVPWAGHLGQEKTLQRVALKVFWPCIHKEVSYFCASCLECQRAGPKWINKDITDPPPSGGSAF